MRSYPRGSRRSVDRGAHRPATEPRKRHHLGCRRSSQCGRQNGGGAIKLRVLRRPGSKRAGERVMEAMRRLYARLKLRINEAKSAVARATERKFLGFSFWVAPGRKVKLHRIRNLEAREGARPHANPARGREKHGGRVQGGIFGGMEGL